MKMEECKNWTMKEKLKPCLRSSNDNWRTPEKVYNELHKEFDFTFDPCPIDPKFNGLKIEWGKRNFVNPPYSTKLQDSFVKKAVEESQKGKLVVMLIPVRTSTKRWQEFILPFAKEIRFLKRLRFKGAKFNAPFDNAIIIFRKSK